MGTCILECGYEEHAGGGYAEEAMKEEAMLVAVMTGWVRGAVERVRVESGQVEVVGAMAV